MPEMFVAEALVGDLFLAEGFAGGVGALTGEALFTGAGATLPAGLGAVNGLWDVATASAAGAATSSGLSSPVVQNVLGSSAGAAASAGVAGLLGKSNVPGVPAAPIIAPPPVMPLVNAKAVADARRKSITSQLARQGRASTILTDQSGGSQKLGN